MDTKAKISANGTYVFDPEDVEQLDELSFTSVIAAIVDPSTQTAGHGVRESECPPQVGDTTINALLEEPVDRDAPASSYTEPTGASGDPHEAGELLAPELIFTEIPRRPR